MSAATLAGWAVEAIIASALLMAAVLLIRIPVRRAFGPQVAYALWALPLLRLLLPPLPAAWQHVAVTPITRASETITVLMIDPAGTAAAATPVAAVPSLAMVLALLWAAGAAGFLVRHFLRHTLFCRRMLGASDAVDEVLGVRVIASDAAPGPLAFGVVRRYVAFPRDFAERYDEEERALALAHEIGHHQRGDLIANWAALAVLAIHWFNPLAWRAFHSFRADQELANDARVLAGRSALERHAYACAIIKAAHGGAVSAACHLHTISDLKGRLRMLKTSRASSRRIAAGGAMVSALVLIGLGLTASGTSAAAALTGKVGTAVGVDLQTAPPPPPAPAPVAPVAPVDAPPPPAPPALQTTGATGPTTSSDGRILPKRVIKIHNGDRIEDASWMKQLPLVTERDCKNGRDGPDKQMVVNIDPQGGKQRMMIICTNRIAQAASAAAATAANGKDIERNALQGALSGLTSARVGIATNVSMTAEQRSEALAGIDEGIAEIQADIAKHD